MSTSETPHPRSAGQGLHVPRPTDHTGRRRPPSTRVRSARASALERQAVDGDETARFGARPCHVVDPKAPSLRPRGSIPGAERAHQVGCATDAAIGDGSLLRSTELRLLPWSRVERLGEPMQLRVSRRAPACVARDRRASMSNRAGIQLRQRSRERPREQDAHKEHDQRYGTTQPGEQQPVRACSVIYVRERHKRTLWRPLPALPASTRTLSSRTSWRPTRRVPVT